LLVETFFNVSCTTNLTPILKEGSQSYEVNQVEGQEESLGMYVMNRKAAL
jgi:hypothetical protein